MTLNSSSDISALYASLPISDSAIRVLTLEAASNDSEAISGTLRIVNLSEKSTYRTLSYVWGDDTGTPQEKIYCNGYGVPVTRNCWSALSNLRKLFGAITIWVDAVSINQNKDDPTSDKEKDCQLPLMRYIYSAATESYIWLGEGSQETNNAMEYLRRGGLPFDFLIRRRVAEYGAERIPTGNMMALRLTIDLTLRVLTFRKRPHFAGLQDILEGPISDNPWISRLWTLQEVLLPEKSVVICGEKQIP